VEEKEGKEGKEEGGTRADHAHVTGGMAEQLAGNIFFYVAACIVYSCKLLYNMSQAFVTLL
jgi:hypothetical protein